MSPGATLLALPGFDGEAVVQGEVPSAQATERGFTNQSISGGTIDGGKLPVVGLRIVRGLGITISNLVVQNALRMGIELGLEVCHEMSLSAVRIVVDRDVLALPESKGLCLHLAHDSSIRDVIVTGYETCVWCSAASVFFHMVHVWNWNTQRTLVTCFHDEGRQNSYVQCYADGPTGAEGSTGYGWYLKGPHTRISESLLYASHWTERDVMVGIYVAPEAKGCTFIGNHFMVNSPDNPKGGSKPHDMRAAFAGSLDGACIIGNTMRPGSARARSWRRSIRPAPERTDA